MRRLLPLVLLGLVGCDKTPLCSSEVVDVARDPGSDRYATTESRNCGATTAYVTVVRVGRGPRRQDEAEEVFVADADHGAAAPGRAGTIWTSVAWTAPGRLSVAYASHARTFKRLAAAKGATIRYRPDEPMTQKLVD